MGGELTGLAARRCAAHPLGQRELLLAIFGTSVRARIEVGLIEKMDLQTFLSWHPLAVVAWSFGALFHIGIWITLELGFFPPYMLCLYLPLLPWERWTERWHTKV